MNRILTTLAEMNITDPATIRRVAELMILSAANHQVHMQAIEVIEMNQQELETAIQQILGGN
jgi:hypothetical protein